MKKKTGFHGLSWAQRENLRANVENARGGFPGERILGWNARISRQTAAQHEAGHAVVGLALGLAVWGMVIGRSSVGMDGLTVATGAERVDGMGPHEARGIFASAGVVAACQKGLGVMDALFIMETAPWRGLSPAQAFTQGKRAARRVLGEHRQAWVLLAEAVEKRGKMDREAILAVVRPVDAGLGRQRPWKRERDWWSAAGRPLLVRFQEDIEAEGKRRASVQASA